MSMAVQHLTDEQRFTVAAKLCQEVLGAIVDGGFALPDPKEVDTPAGARVLALIRDVFAALASPVCVCRGS